MSGRRPWGGYGLALGLMLVAGACSHGANPPTPTSATSTATEEVTASTAEPESAPAAAPAAEPAQEADLRLKGVKLVEDAALWPTLTAVQEKHTTKVDLDPFFLNAGPVAARLVVAEITGALG